MLKSDWLFPNIPFLPLPRLIILENIILLSITIFSNVHTPAIFVYMSGQYGADFQ
jgi:hypothetical protein